MSLCHHHTRDIRIVPLCVPMATIQRALIAPTVPIPAKDPDQDQVLGLVINGLQFTAILNFPRTLTQTYFMEWLSICICLVYVRDAVGPAPLAGIPQEQCGLLLASCQVVSICPA